MDPIGSRWRISTTPASGGTLDGKSRLTPPGSSLRHQAEWTGGARARRCCRNDVFAAVFAERLLTYAAGRAMRPQDMPAVRGITRMATQNKYRFSSFVAGVVASAPFQMKTKAAAE